MEHGNIKLSKIAQMKIETIGTELFYDSVFLGSSKEPDWVNFKQKIKNEKNINFENVKMMEERIRQLNLKITKIILDIGNEEEIKQNKECCSVIAYEYMFTKIIMTFFEYLKLNITNLLPCDINQEKIAYYIFAKTLIKFLVEVNLSVRIISGTAKKNDKNTEFFDRAFQYFFEKNNNGLYEPSLRKTNDAIKVAFKQVNKSLEELKFVVDTDKQRSLSKTSLTWNVLHKLLCNTDTIFDGIPKSSVVQYLYSLFVVYKLKNFTKAIEKFIPKKILSKVIDDTLSNIEFLKSIQMLYDGEERYGDMNLLKIPKTSFEYMIYEDAEPLRSGWDLFGDPNTHGYFFNHDKFKLDFFWYDRKSSEDMDCIINYKSQERYIDELVGRLMYSIKKPYSWDNDTFDKEEELYYLENYCIADKVGLSSEFFYQWCRARIEYAEYNRYGGSIENISILYLNAYDVGLYFAGKYLKLFIKEAIEVFLEEYKQNKKTGRIKEVYQYAVAIGVSLQMYKQFKEAGFNDPVVNGNDFLFRLWDSGNGVEDIAKLTGLTYQEIQKLLSDNKKFLRRNDEASLSEMKRYIPKWECDELGIDTLEDWD